MRRSRSFLPLLAVVLVIGCATAGSSTSPSSPPGRGSASPATSASAPATALEPSAKPVPTDAGTPLAERLEAEIAVPGSPDWPLAAFGSIWVLTPDLPYLDRGEPSLVRIDPATNEIVATIVVPDRLCQGMVASDDAIWVCGADAFTRVDPATNKVTGSVPIKGVQAAYRPAFGGGMVWALGSTKMQGDTVIRIDPTTLKTTSFPVPGSVGGLAYGFDALWLAMPSEGTVIRLDPATGETTLLASGLVSPRAIGVGSGSLWVALHGGGDDQAVPGDKQLARIDPASGEVLAEIEVGGTPQFGVELWASDDDILLRSTRPWLVRIDPTTNELVEPVVSDLPIQGPLTVGFGSIWTVNPERDVVYRVKP